MKVNEKYKGKIKQVETNDDYNFIVLLSSF